MKKIKEITKGKAKSMFTTENTEHLIMHFSDDTSAFDGKKKEALLGKGVVNNQFNAFIMDHLKQNGIETHLIEVIDNSDSLVYKLDMNAFDKMGGIRGLPKNADYDCWLSLLTMTDLLYVDTPLFYYDGSHGSGKNYT